MGVQSWESKYRNDFNKGGGAMLRADLLELDNLRDSYSKMYEEQHAAYQQDNKQYSQAQYETTQYNAAGDRTLTKTSVTGYKFTGSNELQDLQKRIDALTYYDKQMPEAAKTREAQRNLDATKARIAQRKADEAKRRDELRRLRLAPQDVKTSQQGELGG